MSKYSSTWFLLIILVLVSLLLVGCKPEGAQDEPVDNPNDPASNETSVPQATPKPISVEFTLQTAVKDGRILYIGVGGGIDGIENPDLQVRVGDIVRVMLTNGDGMQHDLFLPDFDAQTPYVMGKGDQAEVIFEVKDKPAGAFVYYCTVPGHRQAGQEGKLIVSEP